MLLAINDRIKGWLGIVIVVLIGLTFALWGIQSYLDDSGPSYAAKVNGVEISASDFERTVSMQRQNMLRQYDGKMPIEDKALRERTLEQLVNQRLLESTAFEEGYRVSDAMLSQRIKQSFSDDGVFDRERLEATVMQLNMTIPMYENAVRNELRLQQMQSAIAASAFVTESEARELASLESQTRDISVLTFNIDHFSSSVAPSEDEVKQYYDANQSRFMVDEKVKVDYVEITSDMLSSKVQVDENQLKEMYDAYVQHSSDREQRKARHILLKIPKDDAGKQKAKDRLKEIRAEVENGANFSELAKQYSEDTGSAAEGGDLGWVGHGEMVKPFEVALFNLEPGKVSDIVETKFGYHLIELDDVRSEEIVPFGVKRYELEDELKADEIASLFYDMSERLATLAYENPDNLDVVVEDMGLKVQTSDLFSRQQGQGIASNAKLREIAFSPLVLEQGSNSDIIELNPDHVVVIRLNEHVPSTAIPLDTVRSQIENILKVKNAHNKTRSAALDVKARIEAGEAIDSIQSDGVRYEKLNAIGRDETKSADPAVVQAAFDMSAPDARSVRDVDLMTGDVALVVLDKINQSSDATEEAIDKVKNELLREVAVREYSSAVMAIKESADIDKNKRIIER